MRSYSVSEAAAELGVSENLVYGLCQRKKIRHERHGLGRGTIRIPEDALEEYRRSVTVQAEGTTKQPPAPGTAELPTGAGGFTVLDARRLRDAWASRKATGPHEGQ
jgi:excisionase family DNA binding protein